VNRPLDSYHEYNSLNVGCGFDPWGDVRVDVAYAFDAWHFRPTILADASHLPFRDGSFEEVKASHVLEHLGNPFRALDEMVRVSTKKMVLIFPTEYDVLPWFASNIFPIPRFSAMRLPYHTRKKRLHLWIVNPKVIVAYLKLKAWDASCEKTTIALFLMLEAGRKAKYLRWLTRRVRIPYEYVVTATQSKARKHPDSKVSVKTE
jgi:hypothetical protein